MPLLKLETLLLSQRYQVRRRLSQGSYAEIYEAFDQRTQAQVIIKALNVALRGAPDAWLEEKLRANFEQEARVLATLRHPHIVQLLGQGTSSTREGVSFPYLVLEYLTGGDLYQHCRHRPLALARAFHYFEQVAAALAAAHAQAVIHRDLTPSNLLLTADKQIIKVSDFGVAKVVVNGDHRKVTRVGTGLYAPPEHHPDWDESQDPLTPAADVYSFAKTIYMALAGSHPHEFQRQPIDRLPPALASEPWGPRLLAVLRRATAASVSERYPSIAAFWDDLAALQAEVAADDSPDEDDEVTRVRRAHAASNESQPRSENERTAHRDRIVIDLAPQREEQPGQQAAAIEAPHLPLGWRAGLTLGALFLSVMTSVALREIFAASLPEDHAIVVASLCGGALGIAFFLIARLIYRRQQPQLQAEGLAISAFEFDVVTVDAHGQVKTQRRGQSRCLGEELGDGIRLELVEIPAGAFLMGSSETEAERVAAESPQHEVSVKPFFIGRYPVTQAQWRAVARWPQVKCALNPEPSAFTGDQHPVESLSWQDAVEFCARLSRRTGHRYRLPTEAEWEYACRAGTKAPFHCGETITPKLAAYDGRLPYAAAPRDAERHQTTAVGSFGLANAFGLGDLHGNVWEWCADAWHDNYRGAPADGSAWERETVQGAVATCLRVVRGGSWFDAARLCRSAYRFYAAPDYRGNDCGLRVAMTLTRN
jgi:formylglycine-generating enzyme required for sulfatase activity/serine/threonine protein kinase